MLLAAVGALIGAAARQVPVEPVDAARARYEASFGGAFELTGIDGKRVTDETFRGRPFAVFFGFTRCPDVCPMTLARLARIKQSGGATLDELQVLFITVDPENDTPDEIRRYLGLFDNRMMGATGTKEELKEVRGRYQALAKLMPLAGGGYTVDHTASVFLMGRGGEFLATIDGHEPDATARAKLQMAVKQRR